MKVTRRTAVIVTIWTVLTAVYAGAYLTRSDTYNFNPIVTKPGPNGKAALVMPLISDPNTPKFPIQRVFKTRWEHWLFVPAGAIESVLTGEDIHVTYGSLFFGC